MVLTHFSSTKLVQKAFDLKTLCIILQPFSFNVGSGSDIYPGKTEEKAFSKKFL